MSTTLIVIAVVGFVLYNVVQFRRAQTHFDAWVRSWSCADEFLATLQRQRLARAQFPADLMQVGMEVGDDHVQRALRRAGQSSEKVLYDDAKEEIRSAWLSSRLPALWAQKVIRTYREAFATAAEREVDRLRDETTRLRHEATSQSWDVEVVRPEHRRLPN